MPRIPIHVRMFAFYALIALIVTFPLIANLSTHFAGLAYGDAPEMARHVWWFSRALQTGELLFFQPLLGYPNGLDGSILWATPLQFFPASALALIFPLPAAINLHILLALTLNGWAMWRFARDLLGHDHAVPALIAGVVYMLFPTMQGHVGATHIGLIVQWGVPLYALGLFRLSALDVQSVMDNPPRRLIMLTAVYFFIGAAGHTINVLYTLIPLTGLFVLALIVRRHWEALARVTLAAGIGAALLLIFLLPILASTLNTPIYTESSGGVRYSADLLAAFTPSFQHPLWGNLDYTRRVLGVNIDEGAAYFGIVPILLGIIGAIKFKSARWWVIVAAVAYILSLGALLKVFDQPVTLSVDGYVSYVTLPFAFIAELPFISLARTPGRFNFLTALAVATLTGYGAAWLWDRAARLPKIARDIGVVVIIALIAFDMQVFFPFPMIDAAIPTAIYDLRARDDVRAVLDLPYDNLIVAKRGMYLQTAHEHPLIAGHITRETPVNPAKLAVLQATLDPGLLTQAGADVVIVHREYDIDNVIETRAREVLGEPVYEEAAFVVFNVTAPEFFEVPAITPASNLPATQNEVYFYSREGWVQIDGEISGATSTIQMQLDGVIYHQWIPNENTPIQFDLTLPMSESYHTIRWMPSSEAVEVNFDLTYEPNRSSNERMIQYEAGISLQAFTLTCCRMGTPDSQGQVHLVWNFDQPIDQTYVRFVHLIDIETGELIDQSDRAIGAFETGTYWAETIVFQNVMGVNVLVGWYQLAPDGRVTNLTILSGAPEGSMDNAAYISGFN